MVARFGDLIGFEGVWYIWDADKTDLICEKILSPTLSKGEGDEIRRVIVGFIGKLFEDYFEMEV